MAVPGRPPAGCCRAVVWLAHISQSGAFMVPCQPLPVDALQVNPFVTVAAQMGQRRGVLLDAPSSRKQAQRMLVVRTHTAPSVRTSC